MRLSGRSSRTEFQRFALSEDDLRRLLAGQRPGLEGGSEDFFPTLTDRPVTEGLQPLPRMACKMATGAGKTVVMAMLIAWAFCNRGRNRTSGSGSGAELPTRRRHSRLKRYMCGVRWSQVHTPIDEFVRQLG